MLNARAWAKRAYLQMAKKEKLVSPELEALKKERKFKRKRAEIREDIARTAEEIQLKAQTYSMRVLEKFANIALSDDPTVTDSARIQAGKEVFDRAYGKSAQTNINANVNTNGKPSEITGSALAKRIDAALKRVEELAGRGSTPPAGTERPEDVRKLDSDPDSSTRH